MGLLDSFNPNFASSPQFQQGLLAMALASGNPRQAAGVQGLLQMQMHQEDRAAKQALLNQKIAEQQKKDNFFGGLMSNGVGNMTPEQVLQAKQYNVDAMPAVEYAKRGVQVQHQRAEEPESRDPEEELLRDDRVSDGAQALRVVEELLLAHVHLDVAEHVAGDEEQADHARDRHHPLLADVCLIQAQRPGKRLGTLPNRPDGRFHGGSRRCLRHASDPLLHARTPSSPDDVTRTLLRHSFCRDRVPSPLGLLRSAASRPSPAQRSR